MLTQASELYNFPLLQPWESHKIKDLETFVSLPPPHTFLNVLFYNRTLYYHSCCFLCYLHQAVLSLMNVDAHMTYHPGEYCAQ